MNEIIDNYIEHIQLKTGGYISEYSSDSYSSESDTESEVENDIIIKPDTIIVQSNKKSGGNKLSNIIIKKKDKPISYDKKYGAADKKKDDVDNVISLIKNL